MASLAAIGLALTALAIGCGGSGSSADETLPAATTSASPAYVATDAILSVDEALETGLEGPVVVRGALVIVEGSPPRLCAALAESFPPQCGGSSLVIQGLEVSRITTLEIEPPVSWAESVELLGSLRDGVLLVSDTNR